MTERNWEPGDRVQVSVPYGLEGVSVFSGHVARIQDPGPHFPSQTLKVVFDDPLVFGGTGMGWFDPKHVVAEGETPAKVER